MLKDVEMIEDDSDIASEGALKDLDMMTWMWGFLMTDKTVEWSDLNLETDQCEFTSIRGIRRLITSVLESVMDDVSLLAAVIYM
jgi:hypothetical protein